MALKQNFKVSFLAIKNMKIITGFLDMHVHILIVVV